MLAADSKVVSPPLAETSHAQPAPSWKHIIDPVEPFLEAVSHRLVQQVKAFDPEIVPYADYALNGQGKHLRPALVALQPSDSSLAKAVFVMRLSLSDR